jgi:hypothetical protein
LAIVSEAVSVLFNAASLAQGALRPVSRNRVVLDSFPIDCTLEESHDYDAQITEYEVERGSDITDHRRTKPASITIAGLVSDTPLDKSLVIAAVRAASSIYGFGIDAITAVEKIASGDAQLSNLAFQVLKELFDSSTPFTVVTSLRTYEDMMVSSLRISKNQKTGMALPFVVTMKEIRFVDTAITTIAAQPQPPKKKRGHMQGGKASKAATDKGTAAFKLIDGGLHGGASSYRDYLLSQGIQPEAP